MSPEPQIPSTPAPEEREHAERSASQLKSLIVCAGYLPRKTTRLHWVTMQGLRGHDAMESGSNEELESDYEESLVQACRDYEATLPPAGHVEREFRIETIEGRWGYVDNLRFRQASLVQVAHQTCAFTEADMVDYKFVKKKEVEDAEINLQAKDYVIGCFKKYPHLQKIKAHFPMPRFGKVTFAEFTREDIPRIALDVFVVLYNARRTDKSRVPARLYTPSYDVCRFCARAACPKMYEIYRKVALAYAPEQLPELPENIHASQANDPKVLGALKMIAAVAENWAKSVNHHVLEKALDEAIVADGYELDFQNGQRTVVNPFELIAVAHEFGLDEADIIEASKYSIPTLVAAVSAKTPRGVKKKDRKAAFLDELRNRDAIDRREARPQLVRKISP